MKRLNAAALEAERIARDQAATLDALKRRLAHAKALPVTLAEPCPPLDRYPESRDVDTLMGQYLELRRRYAALCGRFNVVVK
jgi:hypothetical protein